MFLMAERPELYIYLLEGFIMTYTVTKNASFAADLKRAGESIASGFSLIKDTAAEIGKAELKKRAGAEAKVNAILSAYAEEYGLLDTNGKTVFRSALWVVLNPAVVVELAAPKATAKEKAEGKTSSTVKVKAGEALDTMSKHALVDVAKQIRAEKGEANKSGGGRKATTTAGATATIKSGAEMAVSFRASLEALLGSEKGRAELSKILAAHGYRLESVKVQGKAKPAAAKLGALVNQQLKANETQRIAA
jgi:hypothetical protein